MLLLLFFAQRNTDGVRVGLVVSAGSSAPAQLTQLVLAALDVLRPDVAADYIYKVLDNEEVLEGLMGVNTPPNFNMEVNSPCCSNHCRGQVGVLR